MSKEYVSFENDISFSPDKDTLTQTKEMLALLDKLEAIEAYMEKVESRGF